MRQLSPAERLIVAADFEPGLAGVAGVRNRVLTLAESLSGTGVYIKVESVLRASGYRLLDVLHEYGLKVFADLKLSGIPQTLTHDGMLLKPYKPELVTVMANTGKASMRALKSALPTETELLAVTFLTTMDKADAHRLFRCKDELDAVLRFAPEAETGGCDGLICAPGELAELLRTFANRFSYNTPNIRPGAVEVVGDDQNLKRAMTPGNAIRAGAKRVVVGRPITQAADPRDAAMRIIDEIAAAVAELKATAV